MSDMARSARKNVTPRGGVTRKNEFGEENSIVTM